MTEKDLMLQEIEARVLQVIVFQVQMSKENLPGFQIGKLWCVFIV